jgi:hypothetical protein
MSLARNHVGNKLPLKEVLDADMIPVDFAELALKDPIFVEKTRTYVKQLTENGFGFKEKSRVLAEDGLKIAHKILHDSVAPANVRLKALENLVEWADLSPKEVVVPVNNDKTPAFSINIVLNGSQTGLSGVKTVENTATTPSTPSFQLTFPSFEEAVTTVVEEDADAYE